MRSRALALLVPMLVAACTGPAATDPGEAPWKSGGAVIGTSSNPDAGGRLSFRNCPTIDEARSAVPVIADGPTADSVPFKNMILTCVYGISEIGPWLERPTVSILVFDATVEPGRAWDSVRADPGFPDPTDIPGLADVAFATGKSGHNDLWIGQGDLALHIQHSRAGEIPLDQLVSLARAALLALERPPR